MNPPSIHPIRVQTPAWVKQSVFYQIFPDRFNRSPRTPHPRGISFKSWGAPPEQQGFQGGDLYGIVDKLEYLADLGINAIYLNPIFSSASNHRYHTFDYKQVDPLLGGDAALRELLDRAHSGGIRIILDGVFNHASRGFWPFHHVLENGANSPYVDWFYIKGWPLHPYSSDANHPLNYSAWWGLPALPKLNTSNPGVRDTLLEVAKYWLDFGIDGWRLDVPTEINDDEFWQDFRRVVKGANPDAYIVGEIWHEARRWLQGDMFDAVMNYQITSPILSFCGAASLSTGWTHADIPLVPIQAAGFVEQINAMYAQYDWEINFAQMNMLDSHDMPRALWLLNNEMKAFQLAILCQMTLPGAPSVYYGDEIGMSAAGDPYCRQAFPWQEPLTWNDGLRAYYKTLIHLRRTLPALRNGSLSFLYGADQVVAYRRKLAEAENIVVVNAGASPARIKFASGAGAGVVYEPIWPGSGPKSALTNAAGELRLTIPAQNGVIFERRDGKPA